MSIFIFLPMLVVSKNNWALSQLPRDRNLLLDISLQELQERERETEKHTERQRQRGRERKDNIHHSNTDRPLKGNMLFQIWYSLCLRTTSIYFNSLVKSMDNLYSSLCLLQEATYVRGRKSHTVLENWIERLKESHMEKEGRRPKMAQAKEWVTASKQSPNILQSITWPLKKEKSLQRLSQFIICIFPVHNLEYCLDCPDGQQAIHAIIYSISQYLFSI